MAAFPTAIGRLPAILGAFLALAASWASDDARAAGLQVEPVQVTISERSEILWLSNTGGEPLRAQVRVYDWTQTERGENLAPTAALFASPPIMRIERDGRQAVRLVPMGQESGDATRCERAFRLSVDEIPSAAPQAAGLRYVMRYSIPVFVTSRACPKIAPALALSLQAASGGVQLVAENTGTMHAQLAQVRFVPAGGRAMEITPGLLGYVLSKGRRVYQLPLSRDQVAKGGTIEALVNGSRFSQAVPPPAD